MFKISQRCAILVGKLYPCSSHQLFRNYGTPSSLPQFRSFITTTPRLTIDYAGVSEVIGANLQNRGRKNIYEGELVGGKRNGFGKLTYLGGGSFAGEFKDDKLWAGEGMIRMSGGKVYEGGFKDGVFHGKGKLMYKDGSAWEGEYREGKQWNGEGMHKLRAGVTYIGSFNDGLFHGQGKLTYKDGGTVEGEFREGRLWNGKLVNRLEDGEVVTREFREGNHHSGEKIFRVGKVYKRWVEGMSRTKE